MRYLSTYSLFESSSFSNNSKLILKLFKEHLLRQKNLDLIHTVTGIKLSQDMTITKENTTSVPEIRFISSGSGEYTACSVNIIRYYKEWSSEKEHIGLCKYLNNLDNKEEPEIFSNKFGSKLRNEIEISLKCSKGRKINCVVKISFDNKDLLNIDEKINCSFGMSSGEFIKNIISLMERINTKIDELYFHILNQSDKIENDLYKKLADVLVKEPRYANDIKQFKKVWNKLNNITGNGASDTDDMVDMGFFD